MLINQGTAISTSGVLLVPYEKSHVITYHEWMKDEEIQETTASEPLSLDEEYAMQASWRSDHDKLTFITCHRLAQEQETAQAGVCDSPSNMIGDVNLFLSAADEDEEGCTGELELMIADPSKRRQGYGRSTMLSFMNYIQLHLPQILKEYGEGEGKNKMRLLQLKVKIGSKNEKSVRLFQSIGFLKVGEGPNYFGEVELVYEGFLGDKKMRELLRKYMVEGYKELPYLE